jgi:hypothetical protein
MVVARAYIRCHSYDRQRHRVHLSVSFLRPACWAEVLTISDWKMSLEDKGAKSPTSKCPLAASPPNRCRCPAVPAVLHQSKQRAVPYLTRALQIVQGYPCFSASNLRPGAMIHELMGSSTTRGTGQPSDPPNVFASCVDSSRPLALRQSASGSASPGGRESSAMSWILVAWAERCG